MTILKFSNISTRIMLSLGKELPLLILYSLHQYKDMLNQLLTKYLFNKDDDDNYINVQVCELSMVPFVERQEDIICYGLR